MAPQVALPGGAARCPGLLHRAWRSRSCAVKTTCSSSQPRCITSTIRGGVRKLSKSAGDEHCGLVPLLSPADVPFSAALEFVCCCSSDADQHQEHAHMHKVVSHDMVDLVYVLSGTGNLVEEGSSGTRKHPVRPGCSVICWASSTHLECSQSNDDAALAVLRFRLPVSVLNTDNAVTTLDQAQIKALSLGGTLDPFTSGQLSDEDAVQFLMSAHARMHDVLGSEEPDNLPSVFTNVRGSSGTWQHTRASLLHALNSLLAAGATTWKQHAHQLDTFLAHLTSTAAAAQASVATSVASAWQHAASVPAFLPAPLRLAFSAALRPASHGMLQLNTSLFNPLLAAASPGRTYSLPAPAAPPAAAASQCVLMSRALEEFKAFQFPKQTNQLALVFDPAELDLSLSFGVEVFEPGHHTPLHVHRTGYELFFMLSGEGSAYCDGHHIPVRAGDCIVFPPGTLHGLDNNTDNKLYALQMMCPDDEFVAYVQSGTHVGRLNDEDICNLTANRC